MSNEPHLAIRAVLPNDITAEGTKAGDRQANAQHRKFFPNVLRSIWG